MEDKNITIAETYIQKLPATGHIKLTFVRVTPTIKLIHKYVPLQYLSNVYKQVYDDLSNSGVFFKLSQRNVGICDYNKFMCKLFPDFEVQDCQMDSGIGKPDFFLINKDTQFYVEFKNGNDGIRHTQMGWLANNTNKEVWFLFVGGLFLDEFGRPLSHYENP